MDNDRVVFFLSNLETVICSSFMKHIYTHIHILDALIFIELILNFATAYSTLCLSAIEKCISSSSLHSTAKRILFRINLYDLVKREMHNFTRLSFFF